MLNDSLNLECGFGYRHILFLHTIRNSVVHNKFNLNIHKVIVYLQP